MEIRPDFRSVEDTIQRVLVFSKQFREYDLEIWPHLKHKEDFRRVYDLPTPQQNPLGDVYRYGRDIAGHLSRLLSSFNYPGDFPTFKSFVDELERVLDWGETKGNEVINKAEAILPNLEYQIWAIEQMISLYRDQINLISVLKNWVEHAKTQELYLIESGVFDKSKTSGGAIDRAHKAIYGAENTSGSRVEKTINLFKNNKIFAPVIIGIILIIWFADFTDALQKIGALFKQIRIPWFVESPPVRLPFDTQVKDTKERIKYLSEEFVKTDKLNLKLVIGAYGDNVLGYPDLYDWEKILEELEKEGFIKIFNKNGNDITFKVIK